MTDNTHAEEPVSRLDLELLALKRLPDERAAEIERWAQADPELAARVARVRQEIDDAAHDLPALRLPMEEEEATGLAVWMDRLRWTRFLLMGAAVIAAFVIAEKADGPTEDPVTQGQRFRGALDLQLWRVHDGDPIEEDALIEAAAGDRVQYEVSSDVEGWLSIYNIQDNGEVSVYMEPRLITPLQPVKAAVILDDYAGSERIFFFMSETPVELVDVESAKQKAWKEPLAELDQLPLRRAAQKSVMVVKP
ncbi:MAG: hypothetical protein H6740_15485 [Alphaproteobacteria bacterium]|nr:hypothetical protein [Alphaproteobacteria bacterium]